MAVSNKAATTRERIIFFDPFAKDVDLYCSIRAKRNEEIAQNGSILDSDYDDDYDSDINGYGEIEHHRADKSRITYTQQIPTPIRAKLKKAEVVEDLGIIRRGALGPHCLVVGQTVAACVPYDDSESSDSDNGSRERNKERWVIAVVLGYDKRRKLYTVKDKYGPSDDRRGEISWDIAPANVSRFPATRHPRCKPRDRVLALWSTKGSDAEGDSDKEKNEQDGDHDEEEWTSVFYDATVVETEERAGYITIDYGGSSGTRSVRVDKILAISGRQPRRPEKDRGDREQKQERDRAETEANSAVGRKKSKQERMDKETRDKQKESRDRAERSERETRDREKGDRAELHKDKDRGRNKGVKQQIYTLPPIDTRNMHAQDIKLLDDCHIRYYEHLLQNKASLELYEYLLEALPWKEESVKVMGAAFMESRFTVWFGDEPEDPINNSARHAQVPGSRAPASPTAPSTRPDPWSTTVRELKAGAERVARSRFNVVTFTYQDGNDYVMTGTREDEERPGGGTVASLALGSDSRVKLTHRTKPHKQDLTVTTGSLLLLEGATADNYIHVLPKLRGAGRILVTFRAIATPDLSPFAEISSYLAPNSARKRKWEAENGDDEEIDAHGDDDEGKDEGPTEFQCGDVPGVLPGTKFTNRNQLHEAGVHRILVGLVCGTESEGAESLLLAGGTNDQDFDNGNEVCVTGALMHTGKNKRKPNSSWKVIRGTQALITSCIRGLPVRIIRSHRLRSPYAPQSGFSYDGLYRVSQYWEEPAKGGQNVWRFKLCGPTPTSKPRLPPPTVVPGGSGPAHHAHGQHPSHSHMDHIDLTMGPPSPPMVPMGMGMGMGGGMNPIGLNMVGMGMGSHLHSTTSHKQHPPTHPDRSDSPSNRQSVLPLHSFTLPPPILSHPQNPSTLDPSPMHPLSPTLSPFHLRNTHPQQRSYLPPTPRRSMIDPFFLPNPVQQVHTLPPPTSQFSHNYPHPPLPSQYSAPHSHPHQQHAHPPHLPPPQYHPPFPSQYPTPPTLPRMWDELPKQ